MPVVASQNHCYQVRLVGRIEGQETNNVMHFRCVSGGGDSDVDTHLILVLAQCFITHLLPVITMLWTFEKVVWKRVSPTLGPEFTSVPVGAGAGSGPGVALPSFCSAVLSLRTLEGGRSKRGRMYIAGIPEVETSNSALNTNQDLWAGLLGFATCLLTNFKPGDPPGNNAWQMCVYSRKIGGSTFPYALAGFTSIDDITPQQLIGTTRSRKIGRGA